MDSLVGWNEELDALPVEKPDADEQVTLTPAVGQSIDLSAIAGFDAQFYQTGADLWIVFEDGAILVVEGYFEGASETEAGTPRSVVVDGETFTGEEFLTAFAVGDLPEEFALGDSDGPQQNPTSFIDPSLPDLGPGFRGLGLLGNTDLSRGGPDANTGAGGEQDTDPVIGTPDVGLVDEDELLTNGQSVFTGSLAVDFGNNGDDIPDSADLQDTPGGVDNRFIVFSSSAVGSAVPLTSGGTPLELVLSNNDTVLTAYIGAGRTDADRAFEVRLFDDGLGSYRFTLFKPIDHPDPTSEDDLGLTFSFTVTDDNGDSASSTFLVNVNDDIPEGNTLTDASTLDDEAQTLFTPVNTGGSNDVNPDVKTASGAAEALFHAGADGVKSIVLTTPPAFNVIYALNGLAANEAVTWDAGVVDPNTGTVTFTATSANYPAGTPAATLVVNVDGSYTFTLNAPLVHGTPGSNEETDPITFVLTITDGDDDTTTANLTINVNDDTPVGNVVNATGATDDEGKAPFAALSNEGPVGTDVAGQPSTITGAANALFQAGADGVGSVVITGPDGVQAIHDTNANNVADTETVTYTQTTDPNTGAVTLTATGDVSGVTVFTLVINNDGSYTFTQSRPLVHPTANDEDDLTLAFGFTVTDGDGDTASGSLTVTVDDDTPVANVVAATGATDDEGKAPFANLSNENVGTGAAGADVAGSPATITGAAGDLFQAGADGFGSVAIADPTGPGGALIWAIHDTNGDTIADQEALNYSSATDANTGAVTLTATGVNSGLTVFTLVINNDGSYTFTQFRALAHPTANDEDDLALSFNFTVTDGDGDAASGSLTVTVDDDTPVANTVTAANQTDDEGRGDFAGLSNEGPVGTDVDGSPSTITGAAGDLFQAGADGFRSVFITGPNAVRVIYDNNANGIADEEHVIYSDGFNADGSRTLIATGAFSNAEAFRLTISPDGSYTFTQSRPLVHSAAGEDDRALTFTFTVTDGDGDSADGSLTINIDDDTPVANTVTATALTDDEGKGPFSALSHEGVGTSAAGADATGADVANSPSTITGAAGALFQAGADGFLDLSITGPAGVQAIHDTNGNNVADTETLTYTSTTDANGNVTLTATGATSGLTVFTLVINADGSYTFTQSRPLVHPTANDEDDLALTFTFTVRDGDRDTASGSLTINVDDDTPVANGVIGGATDDEGKGPFAALSNEGVPSGIDGSDVPGNPSTVTGAAGALFQAGADGFGSVTLNTVTQALRAIHDTNGNNVADLETLTYASTTDANGNLTFTATGDVSGAAAFTLVINNDGSYTFTQARPLMHSNVFGIAEDDVNIRFTFTVTDGDGDTASGFLTVSVDDDTPVANTVTATNLTDDEGKAPFANLSNEGVPSGVDGNDVPGSPSTITGAAGALFQAGADGFLSVAINTVTQALRAIHDTNGNGIADLESMTYTNTTDANGNLTVTATGDVSNATVFTLVINNDGSYTFTQFQALGHVAPGSNNNEDDLNIRFTFTVRDGDGDTATGSLTVSVDDDTPVANEVIAGATDDEGKGPFAALSNEGVPSGIGGSDVPGNPSTITGAAGALFQAGADGFLSVTLNAVTQALRAVHDTNANGVADLEALTYASTTDANGNLTFTATGDVSGAVAFTLVINNDGSYTFTQSRALMHVNAFGNEEDDFVVRFTFTVRDGDGDTARGFLEVTIDDDTPVANTVTATDLTDDEGKAPFSALSHEGVGTGAAGADVAGSPSTITGAAGALFQAGADGFLSVAITDPTGPAGAAIQAIHDTNANNVADTETLTYASTTDANGNVTLTATGATSGQTVFTLVINNDGSYTFTQSRALVHPTTNDEDDLALTFNFTVRDGDGDTATGSLTVTVDDDTPDANTILGVFAPKTDDEGKGDFAGLSHEGVGTGAAGADVNGSPATITGPASTLFRVGADGFGSVSITGPAGVQAIHDTDGNGVANQETLTYSSSTDVNGNVTLTARGVDSGDVAFTLVINNDGSYTFTQSAALVHPTANNEDDLNLTFNFTVTDGDGDTASGSLTVTVDDDTPVANTVTGPSLTDDEGKGNFAALSNDFVGGQSTGGSDVRGRPSTITGAAGDLFQTGADGFGSVAITGPNGVQAIHDTNANGIADQETLTYSSSTDANGNVTLTATGDTSGDVAFTLVINNDGSYTFTQSAALVHPTVDNEDDLALAFTFTVTDGDGDTAAGSLTVTVDDDTPRVNFLTFGSQIDDEGKGPFTAQSNEGVGTGAAGTDVAGSPSTLSGAAGTLFQAGADGFASMTILTRPGLQAIYDANNDGIADKEDVTYTQNADANGNVTLTGTGASSGETVLTLVVNNDGSYTFTQSRALVHLDANDEDDFFLTFGIRVTDGDGDTHLGTVTFNIDDDTPVVVGDTASTNEDTNVIINVLSNDKAGADGLATVTATNPSNGTVQVNANNTITYTPNANYSGADSFTYTITDGDGDTATATVNVTVNAVNDGAASVTLPNTFKVGIEVTPTIGADPDGGSTGATYQWLRNGVAIQGATGSTYTPVAADLGTTLSLQYSYTDAEGNNESVLTVATAQVQSANDPIILDLDGDGVDLIAAVNGVAFDLNADGVAKQIGWAGARDGMLVVDSDGSGAIENGSEMFSEFFEGGSYTDSLEALRSFDSNGDGIIDASDDRFNEIRVWQDADSDGITDEGELTTLAEQGITQIDLNALAVNKDVSGNDVFAEGNFQREDGSTGSYVGVNFGVASRTQQRIATFNQMALVAGVAMVLIEFDEAIAASVAAVEPLAQPVNGVLVVGEDLSVTFTPYEGFEGTETIELSLTLLDGTVQAATFDLNVSAEPLDADGSTPVASDPSVADETDDTMVSSTSNDDTDATNAPATSKTEAEGKVIYGGDGDDVIFGGAGNDVIFGGAGNDTLVGGDGDDVLIGGAGQNTLTGGAGADTFIIDPSAFAKGAVDIITDYNKGEGDVIDLSKLLKSALNDANVSQAEAESAVKLQANGANTDVVITNGTATETVATLHGNHMAVDILHDDVSVELSIAA